MWRNKVVDSMVSRVYGPTRCDFMCVTEFDRNWREIKKNSVTHLFQVQFPFLICVC